MITKFALIFVILLEASLLVLAIPNEPAGCGGFVRVASNLAKTNKKAIDYSSITMKLLTLEGALKESTPCAPNGYYYLPVYDKGQFLIKIEGPSGWSFSPEEAQVEINEQNKCQSPQHQGEDINFELTGFRVFGKVKGKNCDSTDGEGPSGVTVTLSNNDKSATTTTDSRGFYEFVNVFPGKYKLKASHPTWSLVKDTVDFELSWDNGAISEDFVVSGYDIMGRVITSVSGEGVMGVDFLLYSDTVKQVDCPAVNIQLPADRKTPLCIARSDENGKFSFSNIPCGPYKLLPFYKGAHTTFDVMPTEATFHVKKGSVVISEPFKVMGFSLHGKVVNAKGTGIAGVSIRVDGKEKSVTDANGMYKLDQLTVGDTYQIEAVKEHTFFNQPLLHGYRVSPNAAVLPEISVKGYHLCGRIHINQPPSGVNVNRQRSVVLYDTNGNQIDKSNTDSTGNFCFEVAPGTYKVSPVIDDTEKVAGLLLSPSFQRVTIETSPLLDVIFSQARVTVSGRVKCLELPCDPSLSLSLFSESSQTRVTTGLGVGSAGNEYFTFRNVLPGSYKITIHKATWCWAQDSVDVEVKTEDITNVEFQQSGYLLQISEVNHPATILVAHDSDKNSKTPYQVVRGSNNICVPRAGAYTIYPESCYKFEKATMTYHYDTTAPEPLALSISQFLVKGKIDEINPTSEISDITVNIKHGSESSAVPLKPLSGATKEIRSFEYSYWGSLNEKLEVVPKSAKLLFYPKSRSLKVTGDQCPHVIETLTARPGLFLKGTVNPPLADVTVSVFLDTEKLAEVVTKGDGSYEIGPLYEDGAKYKLVAEKEGYHFEETEKGFKSQKLGKVTVAVTDQDGKDVSGVLLSLSGYSYRSNNLTENGKFSFKNLFPGQYFLRPLLKEYIFEPTSQSIDISEGVDHTVKLKATRIAYSCYGHVTSLNGEPEKFVVIEAVGSEGEYEETQSDVAGHYRLRGLLPNRNYEVRVKATPGETSENARAIERSSPVSVSVSVSDKNDVADVDFVVFRKSNKFDISGVVHTEPQWLSTLQVSLYNEDAPETPVKTIQLGPSPFFEFTGVPKGTYTAKLSTTLSSKMFRFNLTSATATVPPTTASLTQLTLEFHPTVHFDAHEISAAPFMTIVVFMAVVVLVTYRQSLIQLVSSSQDDKKGTNATPRSPQQEWVPSKYLQPQQRAGTPTTSKKNTKK